MRSAPRIAIRDVALYIWAGRERLEHLLLHQDSLTDGERDEYVRQAREKLKRADDALRLYLASQGWQEDAKILDGESPA